VNYLNITNFSSIEASEELAVADPVLKEDLNRLKNINKNYKQIACLSIIRNSLSAGNENVKRVLKSSVHNAADSFDKIMILMLDSCESKIRNEDVSEVIINLIFFIFNFLF